MHRKKNKLNEEIKKRLNKIFDSAGIINTSQRENITNYFFNTEKHLSIDDIFLYFKKKGIEISRSTIIRTMNLLTKFGLSKRIQFENENFFRFEHNHIEEHHDHFICLRCHKIIEFYDEKVEHLQEEIAKKFSFIPLQHKMEIYGICYKCAIKKRNVYILSNIANNNTVEIAGYNAGINLEKKLEAMGLVKNKKITVISNRGYGPVIVKTDNSSIALGEEIAKKILVRKEGQ